MGDDNYTLYLGTWTDIDEDTMERLDKLQLFYATVPRIHPESGASI